MGNADASGNFRKALLAIAEELTSEHGIEIHGKLEIEVSDMDTLAVIKGNRIYLNINTKDYPKHVLKYILAHEIAHLAVKAHSRKFWEIVRNIYPDFKKARDDLLQRERKFQ